MRATASSISLLSLLAVSANAHTYVWSVWVNGVDQGSGNGIRHPAYNGPDVAVNAGYVTFFSHRHQQGLTLTVIR